MMAVSDQLLIKKANGDLVPFQKEKLVRSLENAGATSQIIEQVYEQLEEYLVEGISTKKIYKKAFAILKKLRPTSAARYQLKSAILQLGPSGFPFEAFVGELLKQQGYSVQVGVMVKGHCISHEVDVVAENSESRYMIECKFHSDQGRKSDIKTALYIQSRFLDIKREWEKSVDKSIKHFKGWVFTNTRFTEDAHKYGRCMGLKLISWDEPQSGSLKERISMAGLHPVTCLTTLTNAEKRGILDHGIVLCKQLCEQPEVLKKVHIKEQRAQKILEESTDICANR